jgi:ABC-type branched-subunit amino acid transport system substrate-binding protein
VGDNRTKETSYRFEATLFPSTLGLEAGMWRRRAIAVALILAGCNALTETDECAVDADCPRGSQCVVDAGYCRTAAPIAIGLLAAKTGTQATTTARRLQAIDFGLWVVERDPANRALGRGLRFVVEDTLGSVEEVPRATRNLLARNVAAIIGPARSGEVLESQTQTFGGRLLQLAPSAGSSVLGEAQPEGGRFLFQLSSETTTLGTAVALFFASTERPASYDVCFQGMALVSSEDATGSAQAESISAALTNNCVPITASVVVPTEPKSDYSPEVTQLLAATKAGVPTKCILLAVPPAVAGDVLRALRAGEKARSRAPYEAVVASATLNAPALYEDLQSAVAGQPSLAEGIYGLDGDTSPDRAERNDIEALWREYLDLHPEVDPGPLAGDCAYAEAVILLALAIEAAGTVEDPVALRDAFVSVATTSDGDIAIGPNDIGAAIARIRAARADGRRAGVDYRGSRNDYDLDPRGFSNEGTMIWRARNGTIERVTGFSSEQMAIAASANPGPACARKPK